MYCKECGTELGNIASFCTNCGAPAIKPQQTPLVKNESETQNNPEDPMCINFILRRRIGGITEHRLSLSELKEWYKRGLLNMTDELWDSKTKTWSYVKNIDLVKILKVPGTFARHEKNTTLQAPIFRISALLSFCLGVISNLICLTVLACSLLFWHSPESTPIYRNILFIIILPSLLFALLSTASGGYALKRISLGKAPKNGRLWATYGKISGIVALVFIVLTIVNIVVSLFYYPLDV